MHFTITNGWLVTDTQRVRLAAVTAYSPYTPYGEMGVELITPADVHRITFANEAPSEPEPTFDAAVAARDGDDAMRSLLADLDAYYATLPT